MKSAKAITRKKTAGKRTNNGASGGRAETSPSQLVDTKIRTLGGWRGETLAHMRALIKEADPEVVEEIKWRKPSNPHGVPVWEHDGIDRHARGQCNDRDQVAEAAKMTGPRG